MFENNQEEKMEEKNPPKNKFTFEIFLAEKMGIKHGESKAQKKWVDEYGEKISDIIDYLSKNKEIRTLIEEHNFEEASEYVLKILKSKK
ncbi:MAG: hypothetical protein V1910_01345 [bacterium]